MDDNGALDTEETEGGATAGTAGSPSFRPLTPEAVEAARLKPGESLAERERSRGRTSRVFPGITGAGITPDR